MARLNREAYQRLVDEDIAWLKAQVPAGKKFDTGEPHSLEARHIIDLLNWSVTSLYEPGRLAALERVAAAADALESGASGDDWLALQAALDALAALGGTP